MNSRADAGEQRGETLRRERPAPLAVLRDQVAGVGDAHAVAVRVGNAHLVADGLRVDLADDRHVVDLVCDAEHDDPHVGAARAGRAVHVEVMVDGLALLAHEHRVRAAELAGELVPDEPDHRLARILARRTAGRGLRRAAAARRESGKRNRERQDAARSHAPMLRRWRHSGSPPALGYSALALRAAVVLAIALVAVVAAGMASAVTRGKNGPIYFENFTDATASGDIWVIKPDGTGLTNLTASSIAEDSDPAVSPNGRQIAYSRCTAMDPDGGGCVSAQIAIVNADGSTLRVLTSGGTNVDDRPAWAPNGKSLVFQRTNADGDISLWTITSAGTKAKRIVNDGSTIDLSPSYAPSGKKITFSSDATGKESIYTINANGHSARKLVSESPDPDDPSVGGGTENPAYAPSGNQIVYTANGDLWIININGKGAHQLTHDGADDADWGR